MSISAPLRHHPWGYFLAAALLFSSWLVAPTRALWDAFDLALFRALNGTLDWGRPWQVLWACVNNRLFDAVVGFFFFALCAWYCLERRGRFMWRRAARLLTALMVMGCFVGFSAVAIDIVEYRRRSPSMRAEGARRLSKLVPEIPCKDKSKTCFPADHAFISFWVAAFFLIWAPPRFAAAALVLMVVSIMPRLVGGAHWPTDLTVGSATMLLLGLGLMTLFPLRRRRFERAIERLLRRYTPRFVRRWLPGA